MAVHDDLSPAALDHWAGLSLAGRKGPWQVGSDIGIPAYAREVLDHRRDVVAICHGSYTADYLAACSPERLRRLIDLVGRLREERARYEELRQLAQQAWDRQLGDYVSPWAQRLGACLRSLEERHGPARKGEG